MIIVLKNNTTAQELSELEALFDAVGAKLVPVQGQTRRILAVTGDTACVDIGRVLAQSAVEDVKRIQEPFRFVSRSVHPENTVIKIKSTCVGGADLTFIAGPCCIESEEQITEVARSVKATGATMLRGGAFKPRTSPYSFQGLGAKGIEYLIKAGREVGLPVVTEIMDASQLDLFENVDVIQVGARNMQNFELLKELGKLKKPILLKRGISSTYDEMLMSAEYIMSGGNQNVILCERGIRTFEGGTRATLDISAVPALKAATHLPVIADPSHAAGKSALVPPLARAAAAAGADGVMIEVHNDPKNALCDGAQALTPEQFAETCAQMRAVASACTKTL